MHPAPKQNKTPKIVQVYESMLEHGEVPKQLLLQPHHRIEQNDEDFLSTACWHEFFNLPPNIEALEKELERLDEQRLLILLPFLNVLWTASVQQIAKSASDKSSRPDNCLNALLTLCCVEQVICKKKLSSNQRTLHEILELITAVRTDEKTFINFIDSLMEFLAAPTVDTLPVIHAGLAFLLLLLTSANEASQVACSNNVFFEHLVQKSPQLFDVLTGDVLLLKKSRSTVGLDVLALFSWCCNYHRWSENDDEVDITNPLAVKLSIVDAETNLNGYCQTIAVCLEDEVNKFVIEKYGDPHQTNSADQSRTGKISSLVSAVGSWFSNAVAVGGGGTGNTQRVDMEIACRTQLPPLLCLYYAVYMNRSFLMLMMQSFVRYDDTADDESAEFNETLQIQQKSGILPSNCDTIISSSSKRDSIPSTTDSDEPQFSPNYADDSRLSVDFGLPRVNSSGFNTLPSNLFVSFIEFFSIIMHDTKSDVAKLTTRLCFMTLEIICEDQLVQSWLHDSNICYRVRILRAPLRHQRAAASAASGGGALNATPSFQSLSVPTKNDAASSQQQLELQQLRPLCHTLLDLMQEFMSSHFIVKQFPYENYMWALAITHRLVLYQKKQQIRLVDYPWRLLWECLCAVLKFVTANHVFLLQRLKFDTFLLCDRVVCIFNLFITCGDCFLTDGFAYDQLYYEIVRQRQVFEDLYTKLCCSPASFVTAAASSTDHVAVSSPPPANVPVSSFRPSATKLFNRLVNIRGILGHIGGKIDAASANSGGGAAISLTYDQVLAIVRSSYASLTLRIPETINDPVDKYVEGESEMAVISQLALHSMQHVRRNKLLHRVTVNF